MMSFEGCVVITEILTDDHFVYPPCFVYVSTCSYFYRLICSFDLHDFSSSSDIIIFSVARGMCGETSRNCSEGGVWAARPPQ